VVARRLCVGGATVTQQITAIKRRLRKAPPMSSKSCCRLSNVNIHMTDPTGSRLREQLFLTPPVKAAGQSHIPVTSCR
jgi:hypothetical protein